MRLTPPKVLTFVISLVLALLAVVDLYTHIPSLHAFIAGHRFWLVVVAYAILAIGVVLPGL